MTTYTLTTAVPAPPDAGGSTYEDGWCVSKARAALQERAQRLRLPTESPLGRVVSVPHVLGEFRAVEDQLRLHPRLLDAAHERVILHAFGREGQLRRHEAPVHVGEAPAPEIGVALLSAVVERPLAVLLALLPDRQLHEIGVATREKANHRREV